MNRDVTSNKLSDLGKVYKHEPDEKKTIDGENKKKEWPKK
jgi:hypothetical protein